MVTLPCHLESWQIIFVVCSHPEKTIGYYLNRFSTYFDATCYLWTVFFFRNKSTKNIRPKFASVLLLRIFWRFVFFFIYKEIFLLGTYPNKTHFSHYVCVTWSLCNENFRLACLFYISRSLARSLDRSAFLVWSYVLVHVCVGGNLSVTLNLHKSNGHFIIISMRY